MSDRPYWFECFFLRRDLRDWLGNHFRHLLDGDRRFFLRNRPDRFECFFVGRDLRGWLGYHFRHLLLSDWRDRFGDHVRVLLRGNRRFLLRDYLRRRFLRDHLRCFFGDYLNRILLCRLFALG